MFEISKDDLLDMEVTFVHKAPGFHVLCQTTPSIKHPGYVDYEVVDLRNQTSVYSKRPVVPDYAIEFLTRTLKSECGLDLERLEMSTKKLRRTPVADPVAEIYSEMESEAEAEEIGEALDATVGGECVYFMTAGEFVKIGKATGSPEKRRRTLQTGCPFSLQISAYLPGGYELEATLHRRFGHLRCRESGEWFKNEGELSAFINSIKDSK